MPRSGLSPLPRREEMGFGEAMGAVVDSRHVTRLGWPAGPAGEVAYLFLQGGVVHLRKADGSIHTLLVSDGDITATDWVTVREH